MSGSSLPFQPHSPPWLYPGNSVKFLHTIRQHQQTCGWENPHLQLTGWYHLLATLAQMGAHLSDCQVKNWSLWICRYDYNQHLLVGILPLYLPPKAWRRYTDTKQENIDVWVYHQKCLTWKNQKLSKGKRFLVCPTPIDGQWGQWVEFDFRWSS